VTRDRVRTDQGIYVKKEGGTGGKVAEARVERIESGGPGRRTAYRTREKGNHK